MLAENTMLFAFSKKICFGLLRFNRQLVSEITKFRFEGVPEKTCVCCSYLLGYKHKSCIHCVVGLVFLPHQFCKNDNSDGYNIHFQCNESAIRNGCLGHAAGFCVFEFLTVFI